MNKKVCIKYKNYDLLRIIPMQMKRDYDFKVSFLDNEFDLRMHPLFENCFYMFKKAFNTTMHEVTYHKGIQNKPPKLHLKSLAKHDQYTNFPLIELIDPVSSPEFPIPFLKIGISKNDSFRKFKNKKYYTTIDINQANVAELFLVKANFDPEKFMNKWEFFDIIYTRAPMEYLVNGKYKKAYFEPKLSSVKNGNNLFRVSTNINDDIGILVNCYFDNNIDGIKQKSFVSFYENMHYLDFLALAPIEYYYPNNMKSDRKAAYKWQLEKCSKKMDIGQLDHWSNYFKSIDKNRPKELAKLDGFSLEASIQLNNSKNITRKHFN